MRAHGKALDQHEMRVAPSVHVAALGRYAEVATVRSGDGAQRNVLPPLVDVRLAHMGTNGIVLSGLQVEGTMPSRNRGGVGQSRESPPDTGTQRLSRRRPLSPELTTQLHERYPLIFAHRPPLRCGDGWFDLLDKLCWSLQTETLNGGPQVVAGRGQGKIRRPALRHDGRPQRGTTRDDRPGPSLEQPDLLAVRQPGANHRADVVSDPLRSPCDPGARG